MIKNKLKHLLLKWVTEASQHTEKLSQEPARLNHYERKMHLRNPMHITLYNVTGGHVVKFTRVDHNDSPRRVDESEYESSYIITKDDDFEKALAQFISLEALKNVGR